MTQALSRLPIQLAFLLAVMAAGWAGTAYAQPGGVQHGEGVPMPMPQRMPIIPPDATPSGTSSTNTQGIRMDRPATKATAAKPKEKLDPENTVYLDLEYGRVVIKLHPELAPKTVARFKELVRQGFYDSLVWHRVMDGFMAQTGDPKGDGTGGSGQNLAAEFNSGRHIRGAVSMARASNINSADSQFFIVLADSPHLNGQYTYFGQVVEGMEFVDQIRKGNPQRNGSVPYPDHIVQVQVMADVKPDAPKPQAQADATQTKPSGTTKRR